MERQSKRTGIPSRSAAALFVAAVTLAVGAVYGFSVKHGEPRATLAEAAKTGGASQRIPSDEILHPVTIRPGPAIPRIDLGSVDRQGKPLTAACVTCHAGRKADKSNRQPADLPEFHQGLPFTHNDLSCLSCHNPGNYDTLRLADGTVVEYPDVMTLCAQCHGIQFRDYQHGAHGGMSGYWDRTRGPRVRNNCVDCHDPHVPQFPHMQPTFKPRDRFLKGTTEEEETPHE
jgi:hypothetical protein